MRAHSWDGKLAKAAKLKKQKVQFFELQIRFILRVLEPGMSLSAFWDNQDATSVEHATSV